MQECLELSVFYLLLCRLYIIFQLRHFLILYFSHFLKFVIVIYFHIQCHNILHFHSISTHHLHLSPISVLLILVTCLYTCGFLPSVAFSHTTHTSLYGTSHIPSYSVSSLTYFSRQHNKELYMWRSKNLVFTQYIITCILHWYQTSCKVYTPLNKSLGFTIRNKRTVYHIIMQCHNAKKT